MALAAPVSAGATGGAGAAGVRRRGLVRGSGERVVSTYHLRETIGCGAFGKVKLAYCTHRRAYVAVKVWALKHTNTHTHTRA
jgi:serine/threonine protein kinase